MFDDTKNLVGNTYEAIKDGDTDIDFELTRRQALKGAGATAAGGAASAYGGGWTNFDGRVNSGVSTGVSFVGDAASWAGSGARSLGGRLAFWRDDEDIFEIGVENPRPSNTYEGEIPFDVGIRATEDVQFDMIFDGEEVLSQTARDGDDFSGKLEPEEEGTYQFGVGISPKSDSPRDIGADVTEHQEYARFQVGYEPEESYDPGNGDGGDELDYSAHDLPFSNIAQGLRAQSDDAETAVEDSFGEAYLNRDRSVSDTASDAFLDVDGATAVEYLLADSTEREDIDVYLGFENGTEGVKMRGSASAGVDKDFEEYMVGLEHLNVLEDEVGEYVQDIEDSL